MELPAPPKFDETLDQIRVKIEALVPLIPIPKSISKPHPITLRFLGYDADIANEKYCFYKPRYQHPAGQRLLSALNSFFIYFEKLGFRVKVHGPRTQSMSVDMNGSYHYFRFVCFDDGNHFYRRKSTPGKAYGFSWTSSQDRMSENKDYREYVDITPETLRDLAIELLMDIEERKRSNVEWLYQRQVDKKNDAIAKIAERKAKATLRRKQEIQRIAENRQKLMNQALKDIRRAEKMQELIEALDKKAKESTKEIPGYKKWRAWAIHQVNSTDPRNMSIKRAGRWIERFNLK